MIYYWLTWLMPCHSRCSIGHRQLVSIQLCPALPLPSSSSNPAVPETCRPHFILELPPPYVLRSPSSSVACAVHCSACLAMLSPLFLSVWPSQFHFLLLSWTNTAFWSVFHSSLLDILSGQWMSKILLGAINDDDDDDDDIYPQKLAACRLSSAWLSKTMTHRAELLSH